MSNTRLIIKTAELTKEGILIRSMEVIDSVSGENIRIAELNEKLLSFLKVVEIDIDAFFEVEKLKESNQSITKLIDTFKLYT